MKLLKLPLAFSILIFSLMASTAIAQDSNLGNWMMYFGSKKFQQKWNWHSEVQYRNYNAIGDLEQLLLRTGIGYNLSENNNNFLVGYGYILSQNYIGDTDDKVDVNEHRIFQQFITKQKFGRTALQHRYRFEQRFVEDDFRMRFRYFLGIHVYFNNTEFEDGTWHFSMYNEIFLNTEENVFDRNRLYGGIGYKLSKMFRFELGYMNQFLPNGNNRDQINLATFVNW